jgi:hypothetical protein
MQSVNMDFQKYIDITQKQTMNLFATKQLSVFMKSITIGFHSKIHVIWITAFSDLFYLFSWQMHFRHFSSRIKLWKVIDYWGMITQLHSSTIFWSSQEIDPSLSVIKSVSGMWYMFTLKFTFALKLKLGNTLKGISYFTWDRAPTIID